MKAYLGILVLLLIVGFLLAPSVPLSSSASSASQRAGDQSVRRSKPDQLKPAATTFVVNSTGDSTDVNPGNGVCQTEAEGCTLRAAIEESNALAGTDTINFNVGSGGQQTIALTSDLPQISTTIIINGNSQPGPSGGIQVSGQGMVSNIFNIESSNSEIRGLVINGAASAAIFISGNNNRILGNRIGTDFTSFSGPGNAGAGVSITGSGNAVGGSGPGEPNIIARNSIGVQVNIGVGNSILSNSIFLNTGLGINLNDDGVTPNDATCDFDPGGNNSQNFPTLTSAMTGFGNFSVQGTLNSQANTIYRVEFFASDGCDNSGFGEGQNFIGATNVMTASNCGATFNASFAATVPVGQSITATATDPSGNTSEFSGCIQATAAPCVINCPPDVIRANDPNQCGAVVIYATPTTNGACGPVMCDPPSGALFPVGLTTVQCVSAISAPPEPALSAEASPVGSAAVSNTCSFSVSVIDNQRPVINCPGTITANVDPGQRTRIVDYPAPVVTDNCPGASAATCSPPSGSVFSTGTTVVTCFATDQANNLAACVFNVIINDATPPTITCPANVTVQPPAGQCAATVNYPAPTFTGPANTTVACIPPSGSTFPAGVTTVSCTAVSPANIRATCAFIVTVGGPAQARVVLEGNGTSLEFGPGVAARRRRNATRGCDCTRTFTIENIGCGPLVLQDATLLRTGSDVASGRITNRNDSDFYTVTFINANGIEVPVPIGCDALPCRIVTINPGQRITFRVTFTPVIPNYAGKTTGLAANQVLPDVVTSELSFAQPGGQPIVINLNGRVAPTVQATNPNNTRNTPSIEFSRSGDEYTVRYGFHDPNLNITRARYELLSNIGGVGETFEVDLAEAVRSVNPVRGQSLGVVQRFSGANDNPDITGVRLTLTDAEGSSTISSATLKPSLDAASINSINGARVVTLYAPRAHIKP